MIPVLLLFSCERPAPPCHADVHAWLDEDGDGYGGADAGMVCALEAGQVDQPLDCDDADPELNPDAKERCNGVDDDCDGVIDEDQPVRQWFQDLDGDGFGFPFPSELACKKPGPDWVQDATDCDDEDPATNPGSVEVCGGADEDCDGFYDEDDDDLDPTSLTPYFVDDDLDGYGDRDTFLLRCRLPRGHVLDGSDCDDADPDVRPGATELCNGRDDDCDDLTDDEDDSLDLLTATTWYQDRDRDGHGDASSTQLTCVRPQRYVADGDDCDDRDPQVFEEVVWRQDHDGDGWGSAPIAGPSCHPPDSTWVAEPDPDCNDNDVNIHPTAPDECDDLIDSDCDGEDCNPCVEVVIGVLPANNPATSAIAVWDDLQRDWAMYGDCPARAVDIRTIDLPTMLNSGATVLWSPNPAGPGVRYSAAQTDAIRAFVEGGHGGLVMTYLIDYSATDDSAVADLMGVDRTALSPNYISCQTTVDVLEPSHPAAFGVPATYQLDSHPYAQRVNGNWSGALLPGAEIVMQSADGYNVLIGYDSGTYRGVFVSSMLDYNPPNANSVRTSYNVAYWASGYDRH
ncbi:MAG: putative metal-binding motif-containing protein [Myxococcales bacterium]|nr:putative metal-binding motif-containing protein [Myxococcales bacterium]